MNDIRFDGRVAIVTGAGSGLGRTYALELAKRGAKVVVNDLGGQRDGSGESFLPADKVVSEIRAGNGQATANYDNAATPEGGKNIVNTAIKHFGTVDIVINNAGILRDKSFAKMPEDQWLAVIDVHLNAAYYVTQPAFGIMKDKGYGRILLTTSAAGLYGNFGQSNYAAAKMGLVGLMNTLSIEGRSYNIYTNAVAPVAATRLTADIFPEDVLDRMKPEYVAPLVLYLCSEASSETGCIFNAGMGYFNRVAITTGAGVFLGDSGQRLSPEDIQDHIDQIKTIDRLQEIDNAGDAVLSFLQSAVDTESSEKISESDEAGVVKIFENMPSRFKKDDAGEVKAVFQFHIDDQENGGWHVAVEDARCTIVRGGHEHPSCTLNISAGDFVRLFTGSLDPMTAFSTGKLKITGDIQKALLLEKLFSFTA